jgi:hypothetical protein
MAFPFRPPKRITPGRPKGKPAFRPALVRFLTAGTMWRFGIPEEALSQKREVVPEPARLLS